MPPEVDDNKDLANAASCCPVRLQLVALPLSFLPPPSIRNGAARAQGSGRVSEELAAKVRNRYTLP